MELTITNNREIKPYKVAVKQYESGTTTLVFTREGYMYDQVDLRRYKAFALTSISGVTDMIELETEVTDGNLVITWVVQEQTLRQAGNITYQIVFKESADNDGEGTGVFFTYEALLQNSESIDADRPIAAHYPTILKQLYDLIMNLAGTISAGVIYMEVGEPIPVEQRLAGRLYYQIEDAETFDGHFEDNLGNRLGTFTGVYLEDADINKMITHGDYICSGTLQNTPIDCDYCMVRVTDTLSTDRVIQEVYVPDDNNKVRVFSRAITGFDEFGEWEELATSHLLSQKLDKNIGVEKANMVLVTDADGNIIAHAQVSSTELMALNGYAIGAGTIEARLTELKKGSAATGDIKFVAHNNAVSGWLLCDGAAVSRTTYKALFDAIDTTWGAGDGSTTFNLPNLINKTVWGGNSAGTYKAAGLPNITGKANSGFLWDAIVKSSGALLTQTSTMDSAGKSYSNGSDKLREINIDASRSNAIYGASDTVQPPAAVVKPFIKC